MATPLKDTNKDSGSNTGSKQDVAAHLHKVVCSSYVLFAKTQGYHWNVVGPQFYSLHKMFEEQYNDLFLAIDELAERVRALQHKAPFSLQEMLKTGSIQEQSKLPGAEEMVKDLIAGHEAVVVDLKEGIEHAEAAGDAATADLLTGRLEVHGKTLWMLRATLQS
ncbi:MAG: DNA starvation/stationary phase protection protein [Proteobacteria bacterium]|nr:MAG: DNA starvation/stationary phase protection protein [Pseudomonadota bacterium]